MHRHRAGAAMHSPRLRTRKSAQALQVLREIPTKTRTFQITRRTRIDSCPLVRPKLTEDAVRCLVCSLFKSPNKRNFNELQTSECEINCSVLTQNTWRGRQKPCVRHCQILSRSTPKTSAFRPNAASTVHRSLSLLSGSENESAYPP